MRLRRHTQLHTPGKNIGGTGINDARENEMPMVSVKVIEGVFTKEQKAGDDPKDH